MTGSPPGHRRGGKHHRIVATCRLALASMVAGLVGCITPPAPPPNAADTLSGRIAVHVPAHNGEPGRALSASFELQGGTETGSLRLSSPLGTTLAQAQWTPGEASLVSPEGRANFPNLDALTQRLMGEPLPIAALFDWLRGRPWPQAASSPAAEPAGFSQLGWRVDLSRLEQGWVVAHRLDPPQITVRTRLDQP